jgi:hypothetical protein
MAITIDYLTYEINIPKADTVFTGTNATTGREERELDMDNLWKALGDIQDDQADVWAPTAYQNTSPQDLGTFTLARSVLILAPYVVTFEDGSYSVNLINGNTNLASRLTVNSVQVIPNNSGGLVVGDGGGSTVWTTAEKDEIMAYARKASDNAEQANLKL